MNLLPLAGLMDVLRAVRRVVHGATHWSLLGIPVEYLLHLVAGGVVYSFVRRRWGPRAAIVAVGLTAALKEVWDSFAKSTLTVRHWPPTFDAYCDVLFGLLGAALAYALWRRREPREAPPPDLRPGREFQPLTAHLIKVLVLLAAMALLIIFFAQSENPPFFFLIVIGTFVLCSTVGTFRVALVAVPLIPFLNYYSPSPAHTSDVFLVSLILAWLLRLTVDGRSRFVRSPIDVPLAALTVWSLLALLAAIVRGVLGTEAAAMAWVRLFQIVIVSFSLYYLALHAAREERILRQAFSTLVVVFGLISLLAIIEFGLRAAGARLGADSPAVVFGTPEVLSIYLTLMLPIPWALLLFGRGHWPRWLTVPSAVLGLLAVGVAFSRAGWISALVTMSALVGLRLWRHRRQWGAVAAGFLVVTMVVLFLVPSVVNPDPKKFRHPVVREIVSTLSLPRLTQSRTGVWQRAWESVRASPLVGRGVHDESRYSIYLQFADECGVPAALLFGVVLALVIGGSWGLIRRVRSPVLLAALLAGSLSAAGLAVEGVAESSLGRSFSPLFWFSVALAMAARGHHAVKEPSGPAPDGLRPTTSSGAARGTSPPGAG